MYLDLVRIENFRSCQRTEVSLSPFTPIVGYNNAGKSNVMKAAAWLLRGEVLDKKDDFFAADKNVVVSGRIVGIEPANLAEVEEAHRKKIEPYIKGGRLYVRRSLDCGNVAKRGLKLDVASGDASDIDQAEWKANPSGIPEALVALFPQPIIVEAMADAAGDVTKSTASSTIGRLVAEVVEEIKREHQVAFDTSLNSIRELLDFDGSNRPDSLTALDDAATKALAGIFPGIRLRIHVPVPALDSIFKGATVRTLEGDHSRDVGALGHGVQRSIQVALIRVLSERSGQGRKATNTLLLIDEPELYLHPHAIELTREALRQLSRNGYQVIAATHSAQFVGSDDVANTVLLRKGDLGTCALGSIRSHAEKAISDKASQAEALFSLSNASQILFADRVVLVEGASDFRLIPCLYRSVTSVTPMADRTAIIHLSGAGPIPGALAILRSLGLIACAICDLDFACRNAPRAGYIALDHPALVTIKERLEAIQPSIGFALQGGWPQRTAACTSEGAFAAVAKDPEGSLAVQALHDELKQKGVWIWTHGAIEDHLGLPNKTLEAHRQWMDRVSAAGWQENVADQNTSHGAIQWLRTYSSETGSVAAGAAAR